MADEYGSSGVVNVESYVNKQKQQVTSGYRSANSERENQLSTVGLSSNPAGGANTQHTQEEMKVEMATEDLVEDLGLVFRPLCAFNDKA